MQRPRHSTCAASAAAPGPPPWRCAAAARGRGTARMPDAPVRLPGRLSVGEPRADPTRLPRPSAPPRRSPWPSARPARPWPSWPPPAATAPCTSSASRWAGAELPTPSPARAVVWRRASRACPHSPPGACRNRGLCRCTRRHACAAERRAPPSPRPQGGAPGGSEEVPVARAVASVALEGLRALVRGVGDVVRGAGAGLQGPHVGQRLRRLCLLGSGVALPVVSARHYRRDRPMRS
jgi:hypothetical protein